MTSTGAINAAAGVIRACLQQGLPLPVSQAYALDSAGLLNSPEHAAEVADLRADRDGFRDDRNAVFATNERLHGQVEESGQARLRAENEIRTVRRECAALRARVVELEAAVGDGSARTVDEDPIAYTLTPAAATAEDPHDSPLHHDYRLGHDLPEVNA